MEFDYSELRGMIVAKFGTCAKFAKAVNIDPATLSIKLKRTDFKGREVVDICEALNIPSEAVGRVFFTPRVKDSLTEEVKA